tara:strand:- start:6311 stop:6808 length:498 start_codon:yes stop_codon:yes gene_type:complete
VKETTLYKAAQDFNDILESIDPETGEIHSEYGDVMRALEHKASSVAAWILENDANAEMVDLIANKLFSKARAARKRSEWAKKYLSHYMKLTEVTHIESPDFTFKVKLEIGRDKSVVIDDEKIIDSQFYRIEQVKLFDRTSIKEVLKSGKDVPGAKLVIKDRLTIK